MFVLVYFLSVFWGFLGTNITTGGGHIYWKGWKYYYYTYINCKQIMLLIWNLVEDLFHMCGGFGFNWIHLIFKNSISKQKLNYGEECHIYKYNSNVENIYEIENHLIYSKNSSIGTEIERQRHRTSSKIGQPEREFRTQKKTYSSIKHMFTSSYFLFLFDDHTLIRTNYSANGRRTPP